MKDAKAITVTYLTKASYSSLNERQGSGQLVSIRKYR